MSNFDSWNLILFRWTEQVLFDGYANFVSRIGAF